MAPAGPASPVAPVLPSGPALPVSPRGPVAPFPPVAPVRPSGPALPEHTTELKPLHVNLNITYLRGIFNQNFSPFHFQSFFASYFQINKLQGAMKIISLSRISLITVGGDDQMNTEMEQLEYTQADQSTSLDHNMINLIMIDVNTTHKHSSKSEERLIVLSQPKGGGKHTQL